MMTASTSLAAYHSLSPTRKATVRSRVLEVVEAAGKDGCIGHDVESALLSETPDGSVRGRIKELERDCAIFYNGDTRLAPSGCEQLVMRLAKYSAIPLLPPPSKKRENPFVEGMKYALKKMLLSVPDPKTMPEDMRVVCKALQAEIVKKRAETK